MGKDKKTRSTSRYQSTTGIDPQSQAFVDWQRNLAQQGAGAAMNFQSAATNPYLLQALQGLGQFGGAGGLNAATQQLMNPYIQGVIDPTRAEFDRLRGQAGVAANQAAAGVGGAFGGSRHGVAQGTRLGALDAAQAQQISGLLAGGYGQAQQAALAQQAQQLGQQQALGGLGLQYQNVLQQQAMDPLTRYQAALGFANMGLGPVGQTTSGTGEETQIEQGNFFKDLIGTGLSIYGAVGNPFGGGRNLGFGGGRPGYYGGPPVAQWGDLGSGRWMPTL